MGLDDRRAFLLDFFAQVDGLALDEVDHVLQFLYLLILLCFVLVLLLLQPLYPASILLDPLLPFLQLHFLVFQLLEAFALCLDFVDQSVDLALLSVDDLLAVVDESVSLVKEFIDIWISGFLRQHIDFLLEIWLLRNLDLLAEFFLDLLQGLVDLIGDREAF